MSSPASSRPEPFDLAVVALSARALAASARRAGLRALAIDLFADADTSEFAALAVRAEAHRRGAGFDRKSLLAAIETYAPAELPVALGAGFEHAPGLMRAIARRNPIVGATADQVALLKDPARFAALLSELGVPHPAVFRSASAETTPPDPPPCGARGRGTAKRWRGPGVERSTDRRDSSGDAAPSTMAHAMVPLPRCAEEDPALDGAWLSKRAGASGGAHIRQGEVVGRRRYLQRRVAGRPISALFLADGRSMTIVGFSEQWTDPAPRAPFRYGGAVGPIDLPETLVDEIVSALRRIVAATGLTGLASVDMIVPEDAPSPRFHLLEINPRPGATLDVFDHGDTPSLLALHLDACAGRLPDALPASTGARAAAVVYAERPLEIVTLRRPLWTADWPSCDETVPAGAPICTVLSAAASPSAARALVMERRAALLASLRAASPALKTANTNAMVPA